MNKSKQRLAAFTILELTIAMLLSAVVVAITYTAFNLVSGAYHDFKRKHDEMAVMISLDDLLRKDFSRAERIYYRQDSLVLERPEQTVQYRFEPEGIIRTSAANDTFKVQLEKPKLYFEHKMLSQENSTEVESAVVDELTLEVLYKNQLFPYHYLKLYSSENLFKPNTHANH